MSGISRRLFAVGLFAISFSFLTPPVRATSLLPNVQNLNFTQYTGVAPKNLFTAVDPVDWKGGAGYVYVDAPGTATSAIGGSIGVYGPFPSTSPAGGNFVEADGNPTFESQFNQTITGLTPGKAYTLSFYQAGGQDLGFATSLPTTEQWIVSLGTAGLSIDARGGPTDPTYGPTASYYNTDTKASIAASPLMTTPPGGVTPWQYVSVNLVADSTTDLLSFLAWGDNGSTINLPPIVFLAGVNSPNLGISPEPATLWLFATAAAFVGVALVVRRRRRKAVV